MTTEGDGNYQLQRFLEKEGAECDIQFVTAWILYNIWEVRFGHKKNRCAALRGKDSAEGGARRHRRFRHLQASGGAVGR